MSQLPETFLRRYAVGDINCHYFPKAVVRFGRYVHCTARPEQAEAFGHTMDVSAIVNDLGPKHEVSKLSTRFSSH